MINTLTQNIHSAFKACFNAEIAEDLIRLEVTRKEFEGEFTFVVFSFLKVTGKGPEQSAGAIGEYLLANCASVSKYNVVKGFLNISLKHDLWISFLREFEPKECAPSRMVKEKIMVEYSSPNTNKPLHLGHVRNNVLGYSICRILARCGHEVVKVNLINDRGIHICKSMLAYQRFGNGETPASSGMKGDHLVGKYYVMFDRENKKEAQELITAGKEAEEAERNTALMQAAREMLVKWEERDEEVIRLWEMMNGWVYEGFNQTYARMGVSFDHVYKESETYILGKDLVEEGLQSGVFYREENGSVWVDLTDEGLDKKLLLRADGTSVYMTQDIGTAQLKYNDFHCKHSIYVVGNEQDYHFQVLKAVLKKLNKPFHNGLYHMSYGMVELPEGKLKTREGKVVDADNLMDEMVETARERTAEQGKTGGMESEELENLYEILGLGALKYFLLKVDPVKRILFNPAESIDFQGNTGSFIQYTHARCKSIVNNGQKHTSFETPEVLHDSELQLLRIFQQFEGKLEESASTYSPAVVAQYLYDVAKGFNSFYNACPILKVDDANLVAFRVHLTRTSAALLVECGEMLGMVMPEKM